MNDVEALIKDNKRLIDLEISRYSTNLPQITVRLEAYSLAREAARSYDPKSGFKFSTHLVNSLKKLSRLSTKYGNVVRTPENVQFDLNRLQNTAKDLEHTLGRPPTMEELAHRSRLSMQQVASILSSKKAATGLSALMDSPTVFTTSANDEWIQFVYHDLADKDKLIFEYLTGHGGKQVLDNAAIAKKLNITPSTLNARISMIKGMLGRGLK
jgi:DNA-directed RNA polymerase specialized sigma subunit